MKQMTAEITQNQYFETTGMYYSKIHNIHYVLDSRFQVLVNTPYIVSFSLSNQLSR